MFDPRIVLRAQARPAGKRASTGESDVPRTAGCGAPPAHVPSPPGAERAGVRYLGRFTCADASHRPELDEQEMVAVSG